MISEELKIRYINRIDDVSFLWEISVDECRAIGAWLYSEDYNSLIERLKKIKAFG